VSTAAIELQLTHRSVASIPWVSPLGFSLGGIYYSRTLLYFSWPSPMPLCFLLRNISRPVGFRWWFLQSVLPEEGRPATHLRAVATSTVGTAMCPKISEAAFQHTWRHVHARLRKPVFFLVCQKQHTCLNIGVFGSLDTRQESWVLRRRRVFRGPCTLSQHPPPCVPILTVSIMRFPSLHNLLCSLVCESSVFMRKMHRGSSCLLSMSSYLQPMRSGPVPLARPCGVLKNMVV
jgi:hypothetical protein